MSQSVIAKLSGKYKNIILKVLTNPLIISLIIAFVVILFLPSLSNKYTAEVTRHTDLPPGVIYFYSDLDDNGISEKIEFRQIQKDFFSVTVYKSNKILDQWNFRGKYLQFNTLPAGQTGSSKLKSIFFVNLINNKVFLTCLNPFKNSFIAKDKYLIDYIPRVENESLIRPIIFFDSDKDGTKEFYFFCNAGYSVQPRRVFKYDPIKDTVLVSAESYACIDEFVTDTSGNHLKILFASNAVGNSNPDFPYSDMFSWFMCFDENLNIIKAVKNGFYPSISGIAAVSINGVCGFVCLNIYNGLEQNSCSLTLFDSKLNSINKKEFKFTPEWHMANVYPSDEQNSFYILKSNGHIEKYNSDLQKIDESYIPLEGFPFHFTEDINGDGSDELVLVEQESDKIIISGKDFSNPVQLNTASAGILKNYSVRLNGTKSREFVISSSEEELTLLYRTSFLYYLQYPLYAGLYLGILMIILLIQKTQKQRAEQKYETEKKIAELQLKAIKNQVDPHFTLNIINSIGSLFYKNDRDNADYIFGKYSRLLRQTILNSDKITSTLSDELEYIENYLELEKFRNCGRFRWKIDVDENTDLNTGIPKMLIHTFAENAVKHGLRHLQGNGELLISVRKKDKEHLILIRDNGIGRKKAKESGSGSTGKGMEILGQMLDLYYNLTKKRITYSVNDLCSSDQPSGTEILIKVPK